MNSYDIFKKLTKGLKFNKKNNVGFRKYMDDPPSVKAENRINNTVNTEDNEETDPLPVVEEPVKDENNGGGLQLLSGVEFGTTASDRRKKKKKSNKDSKQLLLEQEQEQVNHSRKQLGIQVWGTDIPAPIDSFQQMVSQYEMKNVLMDNLCNQGFQGPTPIQAQAWPLLLAGRDTLASAPTGSGKTAGFLIPLLHRLGGPQRKGFRALVLAPTRELATQTHRECERLAEGLGIRAVIITNTNKAREKYGPKSALKFDVLITTPNRLVFLLQESDAGPPLSLSNVEMLVVDESDRLFEEGGSKGGGFREQLAEIYQACSNPSVIRAFFSATHSHPVQHWCSLNLNNPAMVTVGIRNTACKDVEQSLLYCGNEAGKIFALKDIFRKGYEPPVLVFVQTKERAKELFWELVYDTNIMVEAIHADRTQTQRDKVIKAFRERKIWVLVCTELMGRGIDFKGVNLIINYDFPPSVVSYIHRVGRTGRAGRQGKAITFWTMQDLPYLRSIAQVVQDSGQEVPQWILDLKKPSRKRKRELAKKQPTRGHVTLAGKQEQLAKRKKRLLKKKQQIRDIEAENNNVEENNSKENLEESEEITESSQSSKKKRNRKSLQEPGENTESSQSPKKRKGNKKSLLKEPIEVTESSWSSKRKRNKKS